jgi:hypothetical protein
MNLSELKTVCEMAMKDHGDLPVFLYNKADKTLSLVSLDNFYVQSDEKGRIVVLTENEE